MRRARDIIGLPILNLKSGDSIGWVQDVVFDLKDQKVNGMILENGHLFRSTKGLPRSAIDAVGKDALIVKDNIVQDIIGIKWSEKVGNQVFSQGGEAKGTIQDVFLDDSADRIVGFEVSDGLFSDVLQGRGAIFQENVMVDGKDVLIVDDQVSPWDHDKEGGTLS